MNINSFISNYLPKAIGKNFFLIHRPHNSLIKINSDAYSLSLLLHSENSLFDVRKQLTEKFGIPITLAGKIISNFTTNLKQISTQLTQQEVYDLLKNNFVKVTYEITGRCNLKCKHCYATSELLKQHLSTDQVKTLIDKLHSIGVIYLTITGGECTSRSDFKELYQYIYKKGFIISLITNGTLLESRGIINTLKKMPPFNVKISLYGPNAEIHEKITQVPGSFSKTLASIKALKNININFYIGCLVFRESEKFAAQLQKYCKTKAYPIRFYTQFKARRNGDNSPLAYQLDNESVLMIKKLSADINNTVFIEKEKTHLPCLAGKNSFHLDCQGNIAICNGYTKKVGNIFDIKRSNLDQLFKLN